MVEGEITEARIFKANPEVILKTAAVLVGVSYVMSYCYQAGVLMSFGVYFDRVPVSLADISRDALNSIPIFLMLLGVGLVINLFMGKSEGEYKRNTLYAFLVSLGAIGVWFWTGISLWLFFAPVAFYLCLRNSAPLKFRYTIIFPFVCMMGCAFGAGQFDGGKAVRQPTNETVVFSEKAANEPSPQTVSVVNTYEKGVLAVDGDALRLIRWEQIAEIRYKRQKGPMPFLCGVAGKAAVQLNLCRV